MEKKENVLIAKTLAGLEEVLAGELTALGALNVVAQRRAVQFEGDTALMYRANMWCRTALSVLKPLFEFSFTTQQEYYDTLRAVQWDEIFPVNKTIAINALAFGSEFTNTHFLAQRTKDAIADHFTEKTGKRPSVDIDDPNIKINIFINRDKCSVSLDSSGAPLFKRGYRRKNVSAPLNEVLGAGLVMLSGWDPAQPLYDPMCGSATFSIEAAMIALNMAPSLFRRSFSFLHWNDFQEPLWEQIREEARAQQKNFTPEIIASDISNISMDAARQNLMEAGLLGRVRLEKKDFFHSKPSHKSGVVIINPPYGRRLQNDNIHDFYKDMGTTLKHQYTGFNVWIVSPDKALTHKIGLRHSSQKMVFNGQIECRFLGYELYEGTKKTDTPRYNDRKSDNLTEKPRQKRAPSDKNNKDWSKKPGKRPPFPKKTNK